MDLPRTRLFSPRSTSAKAHLRAFTGSAASPKPKYISTEEQFASDFSSAGVGRSAAGVSTSFTEAHICLAPGSEISVWQNAAVKPAKTKIAAKKYLNEDI